MSYHSNPIPQRVILGMSARKFSEFLKLAPQSIGFYEAGRLSYPYMKQIQSRARGAFQKHVREVGGLCEAIDNLISQGASVAATEAEPPWPH